MKVLLLIALIMANTVTYAKKTKSRGNSFNPDIGINLLFLNQESEHDSSEDGMKLQEAELQFSSDVDSYFSAKALFAIAEEDGEYGIEPEEVYVETISLPNITLRIGKSKMPIGKHNQLHSHAFIFINAPLVNTALLGDEGLNETGWGGSYLLPFSWFSEINLNLVQGENEELFNSDRKRSKVFVSHFKNLWDLSDSTTVEFGLSNAQGENSDHLETIIYGADLTLKWRPTIGGRNRSVEWGSEFIQKSRKGSENEKLSGIVSHLKYQFSQRWYGQYRYDYLGLNNPEGVHGVLRHTGLIAFLPSEFSGIRLQYETIENEITEKRLSLQLNISIGAHPAHAY